MRASTCKGRSGDYQGPLCGTTGKHGLTGRGGHHGSVEVVGVEEGEAVVVDEAGVDALLGERSICVVDGVRGADELTTWEALPFVC